MNTPKIPCFRKITLAAGLGMAAVLLSPGRADAAFGLSTTTDYYTVDTGAGLVFSVRRTDPSGSGQSAGDISSLKFNGVEYQDQSKGSQIGSGLGGASVSATTYGTSYIKITVNDGAGLTHYYMARNGYANVYMATYFTSEPSIGNVRYIVRIPHASLPNGPTPSTIYGNTGAIESSDVFGMSDGTTRSKHYSNHRQMDWSYTGATGSGVGVWMYKGNTEGMSGGPFYRHLINQNGDDQEIYELINYGEAQTEAYRMNILSTYTLMFTTGGTPSAPDLSWESNLGLLGYVGSSGRGNVVGVGISGLNTAYQYVVGFANSQAQYWCVANNGSSGAYSYYGMIPGTYTMTVYKGELAVYTGSVTVSAGASTALHTVTVSDPSSTATIWRIGDWDGTPNEFLNGTKITYMHPSDVRMSNWGPVTYTVGSSSTGSFPAAQFRGANSPTTIKFNLTSAQAAAAHTLKIGITCAYNNGRPSATINGHSLSLPSASSQPGTRSLTTGTYRENNTTFTWSIPAADFVSGANTLTITPISGNSDLGKWLSASYGYDCVELDN